MFQGYYNVTSTHLQMYTTLDLCKTQAKSRVYLHSCIKHCFAAKANNKMDILLHGTDLNAYQGPELHLRFRSLSLEPGVLSDEPHIQLP